MRELFRLNLLAFCSGSVDRLVRSEQQPRTGVASPPDRESVLKNVTTIPRSRNVGQSYFTSVFTTLYAFLHAMLVVFWFMPELVLVNGPGTCLPIVIAAKILHWLHIRRCCVIYVR